MRNQERGGDGVAVKRSGGSRLIVRVIGRSATRGWLEIGGRRYRCALGRGGVKAGKREGDGATPAGAWRLVEVRWRPDHGRRPRSGLPTRGLRRGDGWCDAPSDRNYNRPVRHPYPASAEQLWREDHLYDIVVVLDHNRHPRVRGHGSAVFMHLARLGYEPTEGCIALGARDMRIVLGAARLGTRVVVGGRSARTGRSCLRPLSR